MSRLDQGREGKVEMSVRKKDFILKDVRYCNLLDKLWTMD